MTPLVLAIEPDQRQAAIVKRIVREKVAADVTVVDSRDAALEAMRTTVPDVLLLSALLSPRDEDELFAHLRTLEHAEHLQTHTIPQLASSIGQDGDKQSKGLLAAFRRRKAGSAPAGCDPELFADEVRTYLKRASDKKREVREAAVAGVITPSAATRKADPGPSAADTPADGESGVTSSWASPFEWRPATRTSEARAKATREPTIAADPEPVAVASAESVVVPDPEPVIAASLEPVIAADPEPVIVASAESVVVADPEPVIVASPEPIVIAADPEPVAVASRESIAIPSPEPVAARSEFVARAKLPLVKRHAHEWWFEEQERQRPTDTDSELRSVLASLSLPPHVAAFAYADGCRIRRVRLATA